MTPRVVATMVVRDAPKLSVSQAMSLAKDIAKRKMSAVIVKGKARVKLSVCRGVDPDMLAEWLAEQAVNIVNGDQLADTFTAKLYRPQ